MTTAQNTQAALQSSKAANALQMAMTEESRLLLADLIEERMAAAVQRGLEAAMTPDAAERFAEVFMNVAKQQASAKLDAVSGNVVRAFLRKMFLFLVAGSVVYGIGGWQGLATFIKWLSTWVGVSK